MANKEVYVVPHSHWDAEWYFTCEDSHILLIENMDYLMTVLERDPTFPSYTFDGLACVIDEYLAIRPENRARLAALIRARRLLVGPWYTQCDSLLIRTESLIRNLVYGTNIAGHFGHSMNIGYLPDIFGQHAWLPAFFTDLGITYCVLQRGIYTDQLNGDLNFYWRAPNKAMIATNYLYFGYGPGKFLSAQPDYLEQRLLPILDRLSAMNQRTDKLLLPAGGDQVLVNADFPATVAALNRCRTGYTFRLASYETYMEAAWAATDFPHVIDGELVGCQKSRIHRTCHSTRYDIKQQTWKTEHLLLDQLEPLAALAARQGITCPARLMDTLWKTVFLAHAHNGIEATNADPVNHDIKQRLVSVERSALSLINLLKKKLSHPITRQLGQANLLVVFNTDVHPLDQPVSAVLFTRNPHFTLRHDGTPVDYTLLRQAAMDGGKKVVVTAQGEKLEPVEHYYRSEILFPPFPMQGLGYQAYVVDEENPAQPGRPVAPTSATYIENCHYRVTLEAGRLSLEHLRLNQRIDDLLTFVDEGDDGDEFDFSPLESEHLLRCNTFSLVATETGPLVSIMTLSSVLTLPQGMAERQAGRQDQPLTLLTRLELRHQEPLVRVHHELHNTMTEHRLRVQIKTPVERPACSYADQGYSMLRRDTVSRYVPGWREAGFVEKPMPIHTLENVVCLRGPHCVFGVMTKGIKEYEVVPEENSIALTLFRSVGLLGKDDTRWRPGRASGINNKVVHTPDALMQQTMTFDYALLLDDPRTEEAGVYRAVNNYREHYLAYHVQSLNTFEERLERFTIPLPDHPAPAAAMHLAVDNPRIFMSMCKPGTDNALIIRLFNPGDTPETFNIHSGGEQLIHRLNLREANQETLTGAITLAGKQYLTLAVCPR
ncbi:glycoside hydrolase family 38 C-terminal domain-containing protein [Chimaeribacter arupi]|uniref:glycoside hydrolase family 38 N-terminal domain-containing protein n=1 Tax=Chimaeribacter arupi TaxID=2060066 RepID=UPI000C7E6DA2|nr:glycoside hydrolase family 38 C-terminal domain-containing protein [Chimaeribacter arupi]PLR38032.1 alpha-mannosidase [Chimaeribacter arupi]